MGRLYADENFPFPVVEELRRLGHDVVTLQEQGYGGQALPDEDVLRLASAAARALLTINRKHFVLLHRANPNHGGIIVCSFDPDFAGQASRIHAAVESQEDLSGQLMRVNHPLT